MKPKYITLYMDLAERIGQMSYATRAKVGAVLVKDNTILSYGWNGMPSGWENICEYKDYKPVHCVGELDPITFQPFTELYPLADEHGSYRLVTKPEVLHAEENAISKVAISTESSKNATLFCTLAPCLGCAKLIRQAGISTVYYKETYRSEDGLNFLRKSGINVHQYTNGA